MELYISLIVVWLVIFVVSVIIEACTTELVSIWFSAGSIIALILSAIPNVPFYIPIIVFIVISLTLLLCLRPIIKKMLNKNTLNSNIDEIKKNDLKKGIKAKRKYPIRKELGTFLMTFPTDLDTN